MTEHITHWKVGRSRVTYTNGAGTAEVSLDSLSPETVQKLALKGLRTTLTDRLFLKIPSPSYLRRQGIVPDGETEQMILRVVKAEIKAFLAEEQSK